jgi:hypothetical protein
MVREHRTERVADATSHSLPSVMSRQADEATFTPQADPAERLSTIAANGSSARVHAATLNRATGSKPDRAGGSLLQLQRLYGNRYVQRVVALARQGEGEAEVAPEVESGIEKARGGGQGLESGVRRQMESAFGADFSGVRVHTGPEAHSLNRDVNAVAFTTGQDVFFRQGAYDPGSSGGRELLAHELTHVVQQGGAGIQAKLSVSQPGDPLEREADEAARAVMRDEQGGLQRQPEKPKDEEEKKKKLHPKSDSDGVQRQPEALKDDEEKKKKQAGK